MEEDSDPRRFGPRRRRFGPNDLDTLSGCLRKRNSKLIDGDTGDDNMSQAHSSLHVPCPVVQINLTDETAGEEHITLVQREKIISKDEELGKSGDGISLKISNQCFEVNIDPKSLDGGHSRSFGNKKANFKEEDQTEINAEPEIESEIQDDLYGRLSNIEVNSKEKAGQVLKEAIPMDGNTEQAFQIDNQPFTIKTEPETQDSENGISENKNAEIQEKAENLGVPVGCDNRKAESKEETVQESMIPRPVDDYTQSKQVIVIGNESFIITINPEYEDDIHCASSANEARREKNVSQKFTVPSSVDGYIQQGQCVQPIVFKTEPEVPVDVSISSATQKANIMEESAQVMTETGLEDSSTQLKQCFHTQPVTVKTEPDTWEEVSKHSADRKDSNEVQTAQILTDTRPRDSYTPLEHHQPFIIKTEPETWDHIPVCSIKKTETNKEKYAQEITVANPVDSNTKIQQIHQIQNQSFIMKSEPVTGDDFLESCVNMEAKSTDKTEQELTTTGLVDGYFQLDEEFGKSRGGRSGRARKKSAKVLEMEEFEEAERKRLKKEVGQKSVTPVPNLPKKNQKSPTSPVLSITSPQSTTKLNISNLSMLTNPVQTQICSAKNNTGSESPTAIPTQWMKGESKSRIVKFLLSSPAEALISFVPSTSVIQVPSPTADKPTTSAKKKAKSKEIDSKEVTPKVEKVRMMKEPKVWKIKSPKELPMCTIPPMPFPNVVHVGSTTGIETEPEVVIVSSRKRKPAEVEHELKEEAKIIDEYELNVPDTSEEFKVKPNPAKRKKFAKEKGKKHTVTDTLAEMPSSEMLCDLVSCDLTQYSEKKKKQVKEIIEEHEKSMYENKRVTAYTLWFKVIRPVVMAEYQLSDFSAISKKLGELWSQLPIKEKTRWKRVAIAIAKRKSKMVAEGKVRPKQNKRITGYSLWFKINRPKVVAEFDPSDFAGISKKLGELWSQLPLKEKMRWKRVAMGIGKRESKMLAEGTPILGNTCTQSKVTAGGKSLDKSMLSDHEEISYEVVENGTRRCRKKLLDSDGYSYTVQKCYSSTISWNCSKRNKSVRCPAVVHQRGGRFFAAHHHIHQPDPDEVERTKVLAKANTLAALDGLWPAMKIKETFQKGEDSSKLVMRERKAKRHRVKNEPKKSSFDEALEKNEDGSKPVELERLAKRYKENGEPREPGPEEIQFLD